VKFVVYKINLLRQIGFQKVCQIQLKQAKSKRNSITGNIFFFLLDRTFFQSPFQRTAALFLPYSFNFSELYLVQSTMREKESSAPFWYSPFYRKIEP